MSTCLKCPTLPAKATRATTGTKIALLGATLALAFTMGESSVAAPDEIRALWVQRATLNSSESITRMISTASSNGFNTIFVQIRGRGDAYFNSGVEERASSLTGTPENFDPLGETIAQARSVGLSVHAWVVVNLVSSATDLPASPDHVIYQHPNWLMVPRALAPELMKINFSNPEYLGLLTRWTRANAEKVEGLYLSPMNPDALTYTTQVVEDLVTLYDVDGVHLDYVRYPNNNFDYSKYALERFKSEVRSTISPDERARVDKLESIDPFAYPENFPNQWKQMRMAQLTALVARLSNAIHRIRPSALVSVAVIPDYTDALENTLQDWRTWVDNGFIDSLCPMAYTIDAEVFATQIKEIRALTPGSRLWAGIGAYRLSPRQTLENINTAKELGANGIILFSYDNLAGPSNDSNYLAVIGRAFNGF